ncbi:MAG: hypothetical protein ACM359_05100 [Bacillota bacterium]
MTDPQPPQPPDPPPPPQLDYESSAFRRPLGGLPFIAQLAVGFGACIALAFLSFALTVAARDPSGLVLGAFLILGLLAFAATVARREWHWPGFLVGVLIVVGLLLLAFGLCIATLRIH